MVENGTYPLEFGIKALMSEGVDTKSICIVSRHVNVKYVREFATMMTFSDLLNDGVRF